MDYSWISFFGCRSGGRALKIKSEAPGSTPGGTGVSYTPSLCGQTSFTNRFL